jgi:hypothetical protein
LGDGALEAPGGTSIGPGTAEFIHGAAVDCDGELTMLALGPLTSTGTAATALLAEALPLYRRFFEETNGKTWPNLGNTDESTPPAWQRRPAVNVCTEVVSERAVVLIEERLAAGA